MCARVADDVYPLHEASSKGYFHCLKLLLNHENVNVNERDEKGNTGLHLACLENQLKCIKLLLQHGAERNIANNEGKLPLEYATSEKVHRMFEFTDATYETAPEGSNNTKEGFLKISTHGKEKAKSKSYWQQYWVTLNTKEICCFKTRKDTEAVLMIEVPKVIAISKVDDVKKPNSFQIRTVEKVILFAAKDEANREVWMLSIQSFINTNTPQSSGDNNNLNLHLPLLNNSNGTIVRRQLRNTGSGEHSSPLAGEEVIPLPENNVSGSEYYGFLYKGGGQKSAASNWQKRWVILSKESISYFKKQGDPKPAGVINLETINIVENRDDKKKNSFLINTIFRDYYFYATSEVHREKWVSAILENIRIRKSQITLSPLSSPVSSRGNNCVTSLRDSKGDRDGVSNEMEEILMSLHNNTLKADKEGYLFKTPGSRKKPGNWQRRWFVLKDQFLFYFRQPKDVKPAGQLTLVNVTVAIDDDVKSNSIFIHTTDRIFYIYAPTTAERDQWVKQLHANTSYSA